MFCPKCGTELPNDATFCGNCGSKIGEASAPAPERTAPKPASPIFENAVNELKAFFSPKPESGIDLAKESNTHEWAILMGVNLIIFALSFGIYGAALGASFGYYLLFGLLIGLIANAVLVGVCFLLPMIMKKQINPINALNIAGYATIPLTIGAILSMPLAPAWSFFPMIIMAVAAMASFFMIYIAMQKIAEGQMGFHTFAIVAVIAGLLIGIAYYLLGNAAAKASVKAMMNSYYGGYDLSDLY